MRRTNTVIAAAAFLLMFGSAATLQAQQQGDRDSDRHSGRARDDRDEHAQHGQQPAPAEAQRVSAQEQQQRIRQDQERTDQYRVRLDQQLQVAQWQSARLQQQRRATQYEVQQQYQARLRQQQEELRNDRDYRNDPYYYTPSNYRYTLGGVVRQTNQYGADQLRQAVNYGYEQGYRAGQADRQDGYRSDYMNSYGYRDANFGYEGNYVEQSDYNAYFREGFRRGYDDGYYSRSRYGSGDGGSILSAVVAGILGLTIVN